MREFRIDEGHSRRHAELEAVYADEAAGVAWVETGNGPFRLPKALLPWALTVEARAEAVLGRAEVFPCTAIFERRGAAWEVEIFPDGYR